MSRCLLRVLRHIRGTLQHGHEGMEAFHVATHHHDRLGVSLLD